LMGIRQVVLAVNKMDLVGYDRGLFERICSDYLTFARRIGLEAVITIPISALKGDNIAVRGTAMPWYSGPTLIEHLQSADAADQPRKASFRFCVQRVNRPELNFRGFSGMITSGDVLPGDTLRVLPSGKETRVGR